MANTLALAELEKTEFKEIEKQEIMTYTEDGMHPDSETPGNFIPHKKGETYTVTKKERIPVIDFKEEKEAKAEVERIKKKVKRKMGEKSKEEKMEKGLKDVAEALGMKLSPEEGEKKTEEGGGEGKPKEGEGEH